MDLPLSIKVHPVFSPDKLQRAHDNPLPAQEEDPPEPVEVNGELEWEVECIEAVRKHRNKLEYQVKWKGWDQDPAWYHPELLWNAPGLLKEFHERYPRKLGPPKNLNYWLECFKKEEDPVDQTDNNNT